jgi:hypothetical protein
VKNKIFAYSILGLNVAAAWISWWVLAGSIYGKTAHAWLYPVLAFSFWGIVFALSSIFIKNRTYLYSSYAIGGIGYLFFMKPGWSYVVAVITVLFLIGIEKKVKKEIERGIQIDFYHLVSHSLKYFVTTVCLVIALAYYFSITSETKPSATVIETKTLEMEMDWGLKAAGYVLPEDKKALIDDVQNNVTVDEFLMKNMAKPEINTGNLANEIGTTTNSPSDTTKLIGDAAVVKIQEEMLAKSKRDLAKQLGVTVIGEEPVKEVLMDYIDKTERSFFENTGSEKFYIPIILAFGLFLTARILGTAVDLLLGLFVLLLIKLLRNLNIVEVKQEQREVAFIEYSI